MGIIFESVPINSANVLSDGEQSRYIALALKTPPSVQNVIFSARSGAYIRGLAKQYSLQPRDAIIIAFGVLRVSVGQQPLSSLAALFSTELKIPNDKAQNMAKEVEKDLIAPIARDLNRYLANVKKEKGSISDKLAGTQEQETADHIRSVRKAAPPNNPQNILDLNKQKPGPKPPKIPR